MIELEDLPELKDAVMIAAFEGWNDAGEAASAVIEHLAEIWDAEVVAALDPEDYYDFQVNRPRVLLENGRRRISWRTTRVLVATNTSLGRDVVLVQGVEPSFRWRAFAIELMELAQAADVSMVVTLGALMADVAHSRPIPVSATSDSEDTRHRHDLEMSSLRGPHRHRRRARGRRDPGRACRRSRAGRPCRTTPGTAPRPRPRSRSSAGSRTSSTAPIEHGDLDEDARAWERGIDELAASDTEVAEYVESLEEAQDTADLPEASGDAIAKEFERYLRRRGTDEP